MTVLWGRAIGSNKTQTKAVDGIDTGD